MNQWLLEKNRFIELFNDFISCDDFSIEEAENSALAYTSSNEPIWRNVDRVAYMLCAYAANSYRFVGINDLAAIRSSHLMIYHVGILFGIGVENTKEAYSETESEILKKSLPKLVKVKEGYRNRRDTQDKTAFQTLFKKHNTEVNNVAELRDLTWFSFHRYNDETLKKWMKEVTNKPLKRGRPRTK